MIAEVPMKHGEAPWFLMWSSALLFAFGMVWAWLLNIGVARTVTILDAPEQTVAAVAGLQEETVAAAPAEAAEPEVIRERKPAAEEKEKK